ncbi:MAG: hypothetical protein QM831_07505 [Kofleriaceae bacterium]
MSYAQRLAAMSRGPAPRAVAAPAVTTDAEAPREEVVEVEAARPPATAPSPAPVAKPRPTPTEAAPPADRVMAAEPAPARSSSIVKRQAPAAEQIVREIEHHTIVEREREPIAMPAQAKWLSEDRAAPDPLVEIAGENQDLQALLRSVRAWTSSPPTPIEAPEPTVTETPAVASPQPAQVSIGNVVITVEDAPAPSPARGRAAAPARTTQSDRLGRSHIRGG